MSYSDYLNDLMVKLSQMAGGDGGAGHVSVQRELPQLRAVDPVTILTQFAPNVVHALAAQNFGGYEQIGSPTTGYGTPDHSRICASSFVDADGTFNGDGADVVDINKGGSSISAAEYVAGVPGANAWQRYKYAPATDDDGKPDPTWANITYEPCSKLSSDVSGGGGGLPFVRQMVDDWQDCVTFAAAIVQQYNADTTARMQPGEVESFYQKLVQLASALDVLSENPPATPDIGEALSYAKDKVEAKVVQIAKAGGQVAAELGNVAGQVAGSFGAGFFSQATFLTLAVAGIAVYVLLG